MIEWKNADLLPYPLKCEGKPYLLLDRSGPLFRLRLGFPDSKEHPVLRIKRFNFKRCKNTVDYDKLNGVGPDLMAMATLLGVKPVSSIKKVQAELPPSLTGPVLSVASYIPMQLTVGQTSSNPGFVWQVDTEQNNWSNWFNAYAVDDDDANR